MKMMKMAVAVMIIGIFMFSMSHMVLAQMEHEMPADGGNVADGVRAILKVAPSQNMVDLVLKDAKTGKTITETKVFALIKGPNGKVYEKELLGMDMGGEFSFMNTLDMSKKGSYSFDILVEAGKKKVKFNFVYEVK